MLLPSLGYGGLLTLSQFTGTFIFSYSWKITRASSMSLWHSDKDRKWLLLWRLLVWAEGSSLRMKLLQMWADEPVCGQSSVLTRRGGSLEDSLPESSSSSWRFAPPSSHLQENTPGGHWLHLSFSSSFYYYVFLSDILALNSTTFSTCSLHSKIIFSTGKWSHVSLIDLIHIIVIHTFRDIWHFSAIFFMFKQTTQKSRKKSIIFTPIQVFSKLI